MLLAGKKVDSQGLSSSESSGPAALFRSFLSRSFRDTERINISTTQSSDDGHRRGIFVADSPLGEQIAQNTSHYHYNFLRCVEVVDPNNESSSSTKSSGRSRVVDLKSIGPSATQNCYDTLLGFAILCAPPSETATMPSSAAASGRRPAGASKQSSSTSLTSGWHCIIQLFTEAPTSIAGGHNDAAQEAHGGDLFSHETCSIASDLPPTAHHVLSPCATHRVVVPLPPFPYSPTNTHLRYVGAGILLVISPLSAGHAGIAYIDVQAISDDPSVASAVTHMIKLDFEMVSAKPALLRHAETHQQEIVVSCVTKRSHYNVFLWRDLSGPPSSFTTPRGSAACNGNIMFRIDASGADIGNAEDLPHHLPLPCQTALVFPPTRIRDKWTFLRVHQGKTSREALDVKCRITTSAPVVELANHHHAGPVYMLLGDEEGNVNMIAVSLQRPDAPAPAALPSDKQPKDVSLCPSVASARVFSNGDTFAKAIVKIEPTATPMLFVVHSKMSCALIHVTLPVLATQNVTAVGTAASSTSSTSAAVQVLSHKIGRVVTEYTLVHMHLHRELSANYNFVLLSFEANTTSVGLHVFHRLTHLNTLASQFSPPTPSSMGTNQNAGETSGGKSTTGVFSSLVASVKSRFGKKPANPPTWTSLSESFTPVVGDPIAQYCEGFCRKALTAAGYQYRCVALDPRIHGFLVWMKLHDGDEVLLQCDRVLPSSLGRIRKDPEE